MEGLARLLVLEKLTDTDTRFNFLKNRRNLRGRPNPLNRYNKRKMRKFKGDLKADSLTGGLEMNDYDVQSLHLPYGPGWDARRIEKLVYQTVRRSCYIAQPISLTDHFLPLTGSWNELCVFIHFLFIIKLKLQSSYFQSKEQGATPPPPSCFLWHYGRMFRGLLRGDRNVVSSPTCF